MKYPVLFLSVLGLITFLSACGFHLRGSYSSPSTPLSTVHLVTPQPYARFARLFRKTLHQHHINVVDKPQLAQLQLKLTKTQTNYPPVGNYYGVESRIYILTYNVSYTVTLPVAKKHSVKTGNIAVVRSITIKRNEAIGSTAQLSVIIGEMQNEASKRLLTRIMRIYHSSLHNLR